MSDTRAAYDVGVFSSEDTLGKTLSRRLEIAAKYKVDIFEFSFRPLSYFRYHMTLPLAREKPNSWENAIFHIFCLIKKLSKMPKFAKFALVISLFKYSRKNFLDWFFNLSRGMTCSQNVFFDVDFLIYFEHKQHACVFQIFLLNQCPTIEMAISIDTSPYYLK